MFKDGFPVYFGFKLSRFVFFFSADTLKGLLRISTNEIFLLLVLAFTCGSFLLVSNVGGPDVLLTPTNWESAWCPLPPPSPHQQRYSAHREAVWEQIRWSGVWEQDARRTTLLCSFSEIYLPVPLNSGTRFELGLEFWASHPCLSTKRRQAINCRKQDYWFIDFQ